MAVECGLEQAQDVWIVVGFCQPLIVIGMEKLVQEYWCVGVVEARDDRNAARLLGRSLLWKLLRVPRGAAGVGRVGSRNDVDDHGDSPKEVERPSVEPRLRDHVELPAQRSQKGLAIL